MAFVLRVSTSLSPNKEPGGNAQDVLPWAEGSSHFNWILDNTCRLFWVPFGLRLGMHGVSIAFRVI